MTNNESSAVDDSSEALNEARDLILGDMAERILDDVNGRIFPGIKQWYQNCYSDELSHANCQDETLKTLWPDDSSPFLKGPFVNVLKEWIDGDGKTKRGNEWQSEDSPKWHGRDLEALEEMDFQGKPDLVLLHPNLLHDNQATKASDRFWRHAISLGTVREVTPSGYTQAFLQVCHQAQQVFKHQPDRLWLDAFLVYGFALEFIIFDRSGVYTSESFDLRSNETPKGVKAGQGSGGGLQYPVVASLMSAMHFLQGAPTSRLGMNTMIQHDGETGTFGSCQHAVADSEKPSEPVVKFKLHGEPIARPIDKITDAGALCYRASSTKREGDIALKISWEDATKRRETEMLQTAIERGVWGVPELIHKEDIVSIRDLHSFTLKARNPHTNPDVEARSFPESTSKRRVSSLSEEILNGAQRDQMKREAAKEKPGQHQLSMATEAAPPHLQLKDPQAITIVAVATAPFGRPLSRFQSPRELLLALRDGIKAHRSLYEKGNILHQDISINNVIIPEVVVSEDAPHGILIDFDEARDLRDAADTARASTDREHQAVEICGTRAFLSIDLMLGRHTHSADHDLESFFYTLLWLCVCHHSAAPPMTSRLNIWQEKEEYPELAKKKAVTVLDDKGWEGLLNEFTPSLERLKPLAQELRSLIFPGGRVGGGRTGDDLTKLYDGFIGAFDKALAESADDGTEVAVSG